MLLFGSLLRPRPRPESLRAGKRLNRKFDEIEVIFIAAQERIRLDDRAILDQGAYSSQAGNSAEPIPQLLRLPAVLKATGLARSTVYRMVADHTFPSPVRLAKRAVGWRYDDVRQWTITIARPSASR